LTEIEDEDSNAAYTVCDFFAGQSANPDSLRKVRIDKDLLDQMAPGGQMWVPL